MDDMIETLKYLENTGKLIKGVTQKIKNETKERNGGLTYWYVIRYVRCKFIGKYIAGN